MAVYTPSGATVEELPPGYPSGARGDGGTSA